MTDRPDELVATAQLAYFRGRDREAFALCQRAIAALDAGGPPRPGVRVRSLHLMVWAAQRWFDSPDDSPQLPLRTLVADALSTADGSGDPLLRSLARQAQGAYLIATSSLPEAIAAYEEAVRYARDSGDVLAQVDALTELGHHMAGRSLDRTLDLLTEARHLLDRLDGHDVGVLVRSGRIAGFHGVAEFDSGRFDAGERWLRRALTDVEAVGTLDQYLMMSNYLGQRLVSGGRYAEGRAVLGRAIDRTPREANASMHLGYNLGLLGKLELEAGRPDAAAEPILDGWQHLERTRHASVRPILRNYLAELLIHPAYERRNPLAAADLLAETERESRRSGYLRSELNAIALRARVLLELRDTAGALALADQAATRLDRAGTLPALRSEEVYLINHDALRAARRDAEADKALGRARDALMAKAGSIHDAKHRHLFLTAVPVSAAIRSAVARLDH
jgi:hypothetical protein